MSQLEFSRIFVAFEAECSRFRLPKLWRSCGATKLPELGVEIAGRRGFTRISDPIDMPSLHPKMAMASVGLPYRRLDRRAIKPVGFHAPPGTAICR